MDLMVSVITYKLAHIKANIVNEVHFRCATISVSGRPQVAMQQYNLLQIKFKMRYNLLHGMLHNM